MKNFDKMQQPIEESLWLVYVVGLWTFVVNCKKQIAIKKNDANKKNVAKSLQFFFVNVQHELQKIDQHIKVNEERSKWGWSPLYHLLKQYPLDSGLQCQWEHMKTKLQNINIEMEKESQQ